MSSDFSKTYKITNITKTNTNNTNNININSKINNNIHDKNIFQNTKLYNVVKPTKNTKKRNRNNSNTLLHNNLITSTLTEGNTNQKKYYHISHSNTMKLNKRNININKNLKNNNTNNNMNNMNNILHNSNSFKIMTKSKSNIGLIKNNKKIFSTIGQANNHGIKTIKNKNSDSIPKKSGDNLADNINIKLLKKEINNYKKELNDKDEIIRQQATKLKELNNNYESCLTREKNYQKMFNDLKSEHKTMKSDYFLLKEKINEYEKNIEFMKKKELKLMKMLYLVKERGIDINSILNEINQITFRETSEVSPLHAHPLNYENENNSNDNNKDNDKDAIDGDDINEKKEKENYNIDNIVDNNSIKDNIVNESGNSDLTVYFPDKVKMNNIMETKSGQNVPKLNFGYVPEYSSDSDSQQNNNIIYNNTLMEEENLYFPKFTKFQNSA
jgi:hypothetical protein